MVAFLAAGLAIAPPASAALTGTVTVSATDVVATLPEGGLHPSGTGTVDFAVSMADDYSYTYYNYTVWVFGPDGAGAGGWSGQYEIASGQWRWVNTRTTGNESYYDEYGTYTVKATVNFYGSAGNVPIDTKTATDTFTFSGPAVPPPPPPPAPPAPVTMQITGSLSSTNYVKSIRRFSAIVQSAYVTPAANVIGTPIRWKLLVDGEVKRQLSQSWMETDTLSVRLPRANRTKRVCVKLKQNGTVVFFDIYRVKGRS